MIVWKTLEALLIELRRRNVQIPVNILEDLRAARSLIELSYNEAAPKETITKIEGYITTVEAYLIHQAQKVFDPSIVNEWLKRLKDVHSQIVNKETGVYPDRFVFDVPRGQQWVRIETDNKLPEEYVLQLAKDWCLTVNKQTDGRLVIYGQLDSVKAFVKQITEKYV